VKIAPALTNAYDFDYLTQKHTSKRSLIETHSPEKMEEPLRHVNSNKSN
jgi:hypothetical protein